MKMMRPLPFLFLTLLGCGDQPPEFPAKPVAASSPGPPPIVEHLVFRPRIITSNETIEAGTAFVVALPGEDRLIMVTAAHIMGDLADRKKESPPVDFKAAIKKVTLTDCFDEKYTVDAGNDVLPLDAVSWSRDTTDPTLKDWAKAGDILAIRLPKEVRLSSLKLAAGTPPKGAPIWLAAQVLEGAEPTERLHSAKVDDVPRLPHSTLNYTLDKPEISIQATSGAPILNGDGDVVGINVGFGFANPVVRFGYYLKQASKASPSS